MKDFFKQVSDEIRENRKTFIVYSAMRLLVIIIMILQILNRNYENVFLCILTLFLMILPSVFQVKLKIELPSTFEIIILLFIFAAEILGEMSSFYLRFPHWDTILHTLNGFLCAAIGFSLVDIMNENEKIKFKMSPAFLSLVAFCFSMTIGVMWEFGEYSFDYFLHTDTQKDTYIREIYSVDLKDDMRNEVVAIKDIKEVKIIDGNNQEYVLDAYLDIGLIDTVEDLFVNFIGASVFSIAGFFVVKYRESTSFLNRLLLKKAERND